jgi:hypothetical protein
MISYEIIRIACKDESQVEQIERYMYGRSFLMASEMATPVFYLYWLVETHYAQAIIDRLGSGLFWARRAEENDFDRLIRQPNGDGS